MYDARAKGMPFRAARLDTPRLSLRAAREEMMGLAFGPAEAVPWLQSGAVTGEIIDGKNGASAFS